LARIPAGLAVRLFTTSEAAEYLRLKERKLYELVAEGAIPCTKVTGKWLFPKDELDRWLGDNLIRPDGMTQAERMPIVGGSHDPLLEWALRESGSGLAILAEGSEAGLARYQRGEIVAAAIHLHTVGDESGDANLDAVRTRPGFHDAVVLAFARREVGLLTAPGNPMRLGDLNDVARTRARMTTRPAGAGAQLLLQALLHAAKLDAEQIKLVLPPCPTGADVAQAIKAGRADCGIAIRAVAETAGLAFVPIMSERFDIVTRQRDYFRPPLQALLKFVGAGTFARRAKEMRGYDVSEAGRVRAAP
jgi:excisionase family DNA binding protein